MYRKQTNILNTRTHTHTHCTFTGLLELDWLDMVATSHAAHQGGAEDELYMKMYVSQITIVGGAGPLECSSVHDYTHHSTSHFAPGPDSTMPTLSELDRLGELQRHDHISDSDDSLRESTTASRDSFPRRTTSGGFSLRTPSGLLSRSKKKANTRSPRRSPLSGLRSLGSASKNPVPIMLDDQQQQQQQSPLSSLVILDPGQLAFETNEFFDDYWFSVRTYPFPAVLLWCVVVVLCLCVHYVLMCRHRGGTKENKWGGAFNFGVEGRRG